jgi:hypothetical protein
MSNELLTWYRTAAPRKVVIPWYFGDLEFFAPSDLLDAQVGYRWIGRRGGPRDVQWNENWVVIGDVWADPIIANVAEPQTPISMDFHGTGKWNPKTVSSSLGEFLIIVSLWVEISVGKYENRYKEMQEYDEDFVTRLRADFYEALAPIVSRENRQNLFEFLT